MKRFFFVLSVLFGCLVIAGIGWAIAGWMRPVSVDAAKVKVGPIAETVDERAITRLPETSLITMPFAGRIEPIELIEGTLVKKDQVVARIVQVDLDLEVTEAKAVVERLEAAIAQNADTHIEETGFQQALQFVNSMKSTVESALARMEAGKARYDYAEKSLGRIQSLFDRGAVPEDDMDRAELEKVESEVNYRQDRLVHTGMLSMQAATDLMPTMVRQYIERKDLNEAVLEKQKSEAEARLRKVLKQQERGEMTSPIDGVILARHNTNEQFLPAGTTLLEIGDLGALEVEADMLSLDVGDAEPGDPVEIEGPAIGPTPARGTLERIYPAGFTKVSSLGVEQQRVRAIIQFQPDDLKRLRSERNLGVGYRVRVRITTAEKSDALTIPRSSLFRSADGKWQVYTVENGRAVLRSPEIGMINDEQAEVLDELEEDDPVILTPESNLIDGQRVRVTFREE